jgi:hypothetical protein
MNILELLKQLKKEIKPDENYVLSSRKQLLDELNSPIFSFRPKIKILQTIYSLALTFGVLIIILSAFVLFKNITPKFSVLNPEAIKAEADAIDFQIQLSKIIYNAPEKSGLILNSALKQNLSVENKKEIISASSTTSSSTLNSSSSESLNQNASSQASIDDILDYLSK